MSDTPEALKELRALVADDSYAITFQTFGQYRTALLKAIDLAALRQGAQPAVTNAQILDVFKRAVPRFCGTYEVEPHHALKIGRELLQMAAPHPEAPPEAIAQLRHLVDDLVVTYQEEGLDRHMVADGKGLMFSNFVGAAQRLLAAAPQQKKAEGV